MRTQTQSFAFRSPQQCHTNAFSLDLFVHDHALQFHRAIAAIKQDAKRNGFARMTRHNHVDARFRQRLRRNAPPDFPRVKSSRDRIRLFQQRCDFRQRCMLKCDRNPYHR